MSGSLPFWLEDALSQHSKLRDVLDERALTLLASALPERALEILGDLAAKDDVRNPSAFVFTALSRFPEKRGRTASVVEGDSDVDKLLMGYPELAASLDASARQGLREADPARAEEILQELIEMGGQVRKPSAFVAAALAKFPHVRGPKGAEQPLGGGASGEGSEAVMEELSRHPEIAAELDEVALERLRTADPDRAIEIIREMAAKGDVKKPSAFAVKALKTFPHARGRLGVPPGDGAKEEPGADDPLGGGIDVVDPVEEELCRHVDVYGALDEAALQRLRAADPKRAVELIRELAAKGDVLKPSAFVVKALRAFPHARGRIDEIKEEAEEARRNGGDAGLHEAVQEELDRHPGVRDALDDAAQWRLRSADPERAVEIIREVAAKGNVLKPSAFVVKALNDFPHARGRARDADGRSIELEEVLSRHAHVHAVLDESALSKLQAADPERAVEVIEELATKGDIRNPSAFVAAALHQYPHKRGAGQGQPRQPGMSGLMLPGRVEPTLVQQLLASTRGPTPFLRPGAQAQPVAFAQAFAGAPGALSAPRMQPPFRTASSLERALAAHPSIREALDVGALTSLRSVDEDRAVEIIMDIVSKGDVRNPSAFVMKATAAFPHKRGNLHGLDTVLSRYPEIHAALDEQALRQLQSVDADRAIELIEDMACKGDVRNPSAFVAKSLASFPHKRGGAAEQLAAGQIAASNSLVAMLQRLPHIHQALDGQAIQQLQTVDPGRAAEILQDIAARGDVRNPSAFVAKALTAFPQKRGHAAGPGAWWSKHAAVYEALDDKARRSLEVVDRDRAEEILQDIANRGDIRNMSAFVAKALSDHPTRRGGLQGDSSGAAAADGAPPWKLVRADWSGSLSPFADALGLDGQARRLLEAADPARAAEIVEELLEKRGEVRNASAFIAGALRQYPQPRGRRA